MSKKKIFLPLFAIGVSVTFLFVTKPAFAISFEDIVTGAKMFMLGGDKKELVLESTIELAPGGDVEKNGQFDAGDIVRFTYVLTNTTDDKYSLATLKTNVDRKQISYIHNVYGATGITNDDKDPVFTNLYIGANEQLTVSFDARINYFVGSDPTISTESEFVTKEKQSLIKSSKKEIKAKRINKEKIPWLTKPKGEF